MNSEMKRNPIDIVCLSNKQTFSFLFLLIGFLLIPQMSYSQFKDSCFNLTRDGETAEVKINNTFTTDTIIMPEINERISGLSVSGYVHLNDGDESYVRIVLQDSYGYEYLVYDVYPLMVETNETAFDNIAFETLSLPNIMPRSLRIETHHATLRLNTVIYSKGTRSNDDMNFTGAISQRQAQVLVDNLNENLTLRNMTWRAKITPMSTLTYEEKKNMFGGKAPQMYGFEHFGGGIFVMPGINTESNEGLANRSASNYVAEWDWRDRHGKNWMTPVKDQGTCGVCWAFTAIGVLESYVNLYYNDTINLDLSEQELVSCIPYKSCQSGGYAGNDGFAYISQNGVVNEGCFPYSTLDPNCNQKCQNPAERIYIDGYSSIYDQEDSIKKRLFKSPVVIGLVWPEHEMVLAGYKTVEENDSLYFPDVSMNQQYQVPNSLVGRTAWLVKNSWGSRWGDKGYGYIIAEPFMINSLSLCSPNGRVTRMGHSDAEIICEDADGDGYYFWGLGEKPSHCPSWAPDIPDGNDSDINYGPIDSLGVLSSLPYGITVNNERIFYPDATETARYGIVNGGILEINACMTMAGDASIRVCEGGTLIIDTGSIMNADITLVPGSTLIIRNGGRINMANGKKFKAPVGTEVIIEEGRID